MFESNLNNADPDTNYFDMLSCDQESFQYKTYDEYDRIFDVSCDFLTILTLNIRSFQEMLILF